MLEIDVELKQRLRECGVTDQDWVKNIGDKDLDEKYQASYRNLCRKLELWEMIEENQNGEDEDDKLPVPSFELLKKHCEVENNKMGAFLAGKQSYDGGNLVSDVVDRDQDQPR